MHKRWHNNHPNIIHTLRGNLTFSPSDDVSIRRYVYVTMTYAYIIMTYMYIIMTYVYIIMTYAQVKFFFQRRNNAVLVHHDVHVVSFSFDSIPLDVRHRNRIGSKTARGCIVTHQVEQHEAQPKDVSDLKHKTCRTHPKNIFQRPEICQLI